MILNSFCTIIYQDHRRATVQEHEVRREATAQKFPTLLSTNLIVIQKMPISHPILQATISICVVQVERRMTMYILSKRLLHLENPPA